MTNEDFIRQSKEQLKEQLWKQGRVNLSTKVGIKIVGTIHIEVVEQTSKLKSNFIKTTLKG